MKNSSSLFVSTPWENISDRLGDPLSFQRFAEQIADDLVPDISSRQFDARWLTLLCKGLSKIDVTDVEMRYKRMSQWERGILIFASDNFNDQERQLPGKLIAPTGWPHRYRFYGPYGSYRSLLINTGLTEDDGWTLTEVGWKLSKYIKLGFRFFGDKPVNLVDPKWMQWSPGESLKMPEKRLLYQKLFHDGEAAAKRYKTLKQLGRVWKAYPLYAWFDQFTHECFMVLNDNLCKANPGGEFSLPDYNFTTLNNLPNDIPSDWSEIIELAEDLEKHGAKALFEHHLQIEMRGLRWFAKQRNHYIRLADQNASMRTAYNYRFQALWRLGIQLCPNQAPKKYPSSLVREEFIND